MENTQKQPAFCLQKLGFCSHTGSFLANVRPVTQFLGIGVVALCNYWVFWSSRRIVLWYEIIDRSKKNNENENAMGRSGLRQTKAIAQGQYKLFETSIEACNKDFKKVQVCSNEIFQ